LSVGVYFFSFPPQIFRTPPPNVPAEILPSCQSESYNFDVKPTLPDIGAQAHWVQAGKTETAYRIARLFASTQIYLYAARPLSILLLFLSLAWTDDENLAAYPFSINYQHYGFNMSEDVKSILKLTPVARPLNLV
jgi:hypothetical protein